MKNSRGAAEGLKPHYQKVPQLAVIRGSADSGRLMEMRD